jgi:hypothetical protein
MKRVATILLIVFPFVLLAQEPKNQTVNLFGFVKTDYFFDSRENYNIREGHFLMFPKERFLDASGYDINSKGSFNFLSVQSRFGMRFSGPDVLNAKVSGLLEADFFGNENAAFIDNNGFRLRHAFVKLNWEKTEITAGQYWHPFFIASCFSGVVSFNTGSPMQPFARNPQLRIQQKVGRITATAALSAQRDFTSPQGAYALRYANLPDLNALLQYDNAYNNSELKIQLGAGLGYKKLQPLLFTSKGGKNFQTNEKVNAISATAYLKLSSSSLTFKSQATYGQNLFDLLMIGGYAVHSVKDSLKNSVDYTTINNFSMWTELHTNSKQLQLGLWGGFTRNLGSLNEILNYSNRVNGTESTVRGGNLHHVWRLSPRIVAMREKFHIALETELTSAAYADADATGTLARNKFGQVTDYYVVNNLRVLMAVIYHF